MSDDYRAIRIDDSNVPIVEVVLKRGDNENAMDGRAMGEVNQAIQSLGNRRDVHVIVVSSEGENFSAGGDMEWLENLLDAEWWRSSLENPEMSNGYGILSVPQPVITKIQGVALGAGAELATFADIPVAANDSRIGDLHSVLGVVGPHTPGLWPELMSTNKAKELIMRGNTVSGKEAERIGLVNHAVPADELDEKVDEIAEDLATGSQVAIRSSKRAVNRHIQKSMMRGAAESSSLEAWNAMLGDMEAAVKTLQKTMDHEQIEYPSTQFE